MRSLLAAALFTNVAFAASTPVRELTTELPLVGSNPATYFRHGRLFQIRPVLKVYATDGTFAFNAPVRAPNGNLSFVDDIDVDSDGSFVAATPRGLALLNARGIQTGFIATGDFKPEQVAISEDGSIWTHGIEPKPDYMLRKYSRDGELEGKYLPLSTFAFAPASYSGRIALMASGNDIALAVFAELIHLDSHGNVVRRMPLDRPKMAFAGFGFTSDRKLYGWGHDALVLFDLATGSWTKTETPYQYGFFGADGATLVFYGDKGDGMTTIAWFKQPD